MKSRLVVLMVLGAMVALMLALGGAAWAGGTGCNPDLDTCPPPPDDGGGNGGNGGGGGGTDRNDGGDRNRRGGGGSGGGGRGGGFFIHFGAGYPYSGKTTVDFGAFAGTRFFPTDPVFPNDPLRGYSTTFPTDPMFPTDPIRSYSTTFSAQSFNTLPPNPVRRF
jgi:hypothetical protein